MGFEMGSVTQQYWAYDESTISDIAVTFLISVTIMSLCMILLCIFNIWLSMSFIIVGNAIASPMMMSAITHCNSRFSLTRYYWKMRDDIVRF